MPGKHSKSLLGPLRIHVYSLCWNELPVLPFYFRHYDEWVERFFILDDGSDDGSLELLQSKPKVELERFAKDDSSFVLSALRFYNQQWKNSRGRADWVIVCNIDEHLYHPDLPGYLRRCTERGITIVASAGYQMISEQFPDVEGRLCNHVKEGARWSRMDKVSIFNPDAISEIGYNPGRHAAVPVGNVHWPERTEVKLLHYKYLGLNYLQRRLHQLRSGLLPLDIERGYGHKYHWTTVEIERDFHTVRLGAQPVL